MFRPVATILSIPLVTIHLMWSAAPARQQQGKLSVPLVITEDYEQPVDFLLAFPAPRGSAGGVSLSLPEGSDAATTTAPGGVLVRVGRLADPPHAYRLQVDSNGDGDVAGEVSQIATPGSAVAVKVMRRWANGRQQALPYLIKYQRGVGRDGKVRESFLWLPHHRAEGRLKIGNCDALIVALDINGDGLFGRDDFARGTSIGLDRDGDGRIWGGAEWLKGEEIIEFCGSSFLIQNLEADGTALTIAETSLRVPKIGEQLPEFSLLTTDGRTLNSKDLRGRVHLLDFWASWCRPCVEKFPLVRRLGDEYKKELAVLAINVDDEKGLPSARRAIEEYQLTWPHVMAGRGESDPLWKMFGSMEGNRLSIPLYVLVDSDGRLRYAGNGGKDLSDLRAKVKESVEAEQPASRHK